MNVDDIYMGPFSIEGLLQSKALEPLPASATEELAKIEKLDLKEFNETEIRYFVIDPMIRILGYDKGTGFSVDLGKPISFLNTNKFPDYKFSLWEDDFWLIEAKRPRVSQSSFGYEDLAQAVEYAAHPSINAALVVLCDGLKIEIFDREVSLSEPILHVDQSNYVRDFFLIRKLLEPWQVWFFQKRRVVRLIDKVFDKEFNPGRIEEFRALIERRLSSKRHTVLTNFRSRVKPDTAKYLEQIAAAPIDEVIDVHLMFLASESVVMALTDRLIELSRATTFHVLFRLFPDNPRDYNDTLFAHALAYVITLAEKRPTVEWLPSWLAGAHQNAPPLQGAINKLIRCCLNYFSDDEPRRIVLLAAAALRRVIKLQILVDEASWRRAEVLHGLHRFFVSELSWSQILASPANQIVTMLDTSAASATRAFVQECRAANGALNSEIAKQKLRDLWKVEIELLAGFDNYRKLCLERKLDELRCPESYAVTFDHLGHYALCIISLFPSWQSYVVQTHHDEIATLASMGSWKARELLGIDPATSLPPAADSVLADRFFFGDVRMLESLRSAYARS